MKISACGGIGFRSTADDLHKNVIADIVGSAMTRIFHRLWMEEEGQDIAEYAVMLAVILVLVVGTIRLIGSNAKNVFSETASSIQ